MGYQEALEEAGAIVLEFAEFGSYQGDWYAVVAHNDIIYLIHDYYGSCSGCDAFEADMGWTDSSTPEYKKKLAEFGKKYLDDYADIDKEIKDHEERTWDLDGQAVVKFLKEIKAAYRLGDMNGS